MQAPQPCQTPRSHESPGRPAPRRRAAAACSRSAPTRGGHELLEWMPGARRARCPARSAAFDAVVVFGGGMNVRDAGPAAVAARRDRAAARRAPAGACRCSAICLGAQLLAVAAGAEVRRSAVARDRLVRRRADRDGAPIPCSARLPERFLAYEWHSYAFDAARRRRRAGAQRGLLAGVPARRDRVGGAVPPRGDAGDRARVGAATTRATRTRSRMGFDAGGAHRAGGRARCRSGWSIGRRLFDALPRLQQRAAAAASRLGRRRLDQLRALHPRAVDRRVGRRARRCARRRAARTARDRRRRPATRPPRPGPASTTGIRSWTGAQTSLARVVRIVADAIQSSPILRASRTARRTRTARRRRPCSGTGSAAAWGSPSAATRTSRRRAPGSGGRGGRTGRRTASWSATVSRAALIGSCPLPSSLRPARHEPPADGAHASARPPSRRRPRSARSGTR